MKVLASFIAQLFAPPPSVLHAPSPDARVTPDAARCVQCGVCGYNCPVGIPVRDYARRGKSVDDIRCVQCGQCIEACPRGTLRWGTMFALAVEPSPYDHILNQYFSAEEQNR